MIGNVFEIEALSLAKVRFLWCTSIWLRSIHILIWSKTLQKTRMVFRVRTSHRIEHTSLQFKNQHRIPISPVRWTVDCQVRTTDAKYAKQMTSTHNRWLSTHTFLCKTQFDWLKISFQKMGCQKINSTNVEEKIMPVSLLTMIRKRIFGSSVPKHYTWKMIYKENTSSSCIHISSIDQGATRLGGL